MGTKFTAGNPVWVTLTLDSVDVKLRGVVSGCKFTHGAQFYDVIVDTEEGHMYVRETHLLLRN